MRGVGIVGLGDMGMGMALNLIKHGHRVFGVDLRSERVSMLEEAGGQGAELSDIGKSVDLVFLMVLDEAQVEGALLGPAGLLSSLEPNAIVVVSATIGRAAMERLGKIAAQHPIRLLDCPVSGGRAGANAGTLSMMVGGELAILDEARPALACIASKIMHVGSRVGDGQAVKSVLQGVIGAAFANLCEAMALAKKAGIDGEVMRQALIESIVGSKLIEGTSRMILDRNFQNSGAHVAVILKDLGLTLDMAQGHGVPMMSTSAARELFRAALSTYPQSDIWVAAELIERLSEPLPPRD